MSSSSSKKSTKLEALTLKPSECAAAIRALIPTNRAMFLWGAPGISKSKTAQAVATAEGMAFIDLRLSQMDPTDLRGIPYPTKVGGVEGVRWSTPYVMPRDLDVSMTVEIDGEETIHFGNPIGSNGIHYVTDPKVSVRAIGDGEAEIVEQSPDRVHVRFLQGGKPATGRVRVTVTGKARGILGLEEFNSAPPSVQAAAYQLVLDRRLGEYIVPDGVFIMGMGNRDTDRGVTYKMPTPIMNRFVHVEMKVDFDDWQRWALLNRIHPDVVGYLNAFHQQIFQFDPNSAARGFPTPRSWEYVSDILTANEDLPEMVMIGLITGAIGDEFGIQFVEFRRIAADLPDARDVLSGKLKKLPKKVEVSLAYALTTTLCYQLKEQSDEIRRTKGQNWMKSPERDEWLKKADNFLEFIMENFQPEICIMGAKAAIQVHKLPFDTQKMKNFDVFAEKYKGLIVG